MSYDFFEGFKERKPVKVKSKRTFFFRSPLKVIPIFPLADDDDDNDDDNSDFITVSRKIAEENPSANRDSRKYLKR